MPGILAFSRLYDNPYRTLHNVSSIHELGIPRALNDTPPHLNHVVAVPPELGLQNSHGDRDNLLVHILKYLPYNVLLGPFKSWVCASTARLSSSQHPPLHTISKHRHTRTCRPKSRLSLVKQCHRRRAIRSLFTWAAAGRLSRDMAETLLRCFLFLKMRIHA